MKLLYSTNMTVTKTYKTYANAEKAARKVVGERNIRVLIAATDEGRFFPVAIGEQALQEGIHFHFAVAR